MGTKSAVQIRAELERKGISIAQWATANGLSTFLVYELLSGRKKGARGEALRAIGVDAAAASSAPA